MAKGPIEKTIYPKGPDGKFLPRGKTKNDSAPKKSPGRPPTRNLEESLAAFLVSIGVLISAFEPFDGQVIVSGVPALATSLEGLAKQNPKVRKALESMLSAGAWSGVIMSSAAIILPIAAHHKILPASIAQVLPFPLKGADGEKKSEPDLDSIPTSQREGILD